MLREVKLMAQLGVDGIIPFGGLRSSIGLLAPEIYRKMVYPWHKAHVAEAHRHGLKVLKHCCRILLYINELVEVVYDAYEVIQASGGMDIRKLKTGRRSDLPVGRNIAGTHHSRQTGGYSP